MILPKRPRPTDHWALYLARDPGRDIDVLAEHARRNERSFNLWRMT